MICSLCNRKYYEGMPCQHVECELYKLRRPMPEQDHWTFPEDTEVKARPGWKWIKLDKIWWFPRMDGFMKWHDKVTKKGSIVQKLGVSVERLNEAQHKILENIPDSGTPEKVVDGFVKRIQRFFYEGKLK
jgi:hypothetical protein